jgi:TRAP-type C4-dicarboxylate transport system permease small subunit
MKAITQLLQKICRICAIASEIFVLMLMFLVTAEIIGRRLFGAPIPGQVETATLSLTIIIYLGLAYTQLKNSNIRVEIFINRLPARCKAFVEAGCLLLSLIPIILMSLATTQKAYLSFKGGEFIAGGINYPVWPGRCAVAFGLGLLCITLAVQMLNHLTLAFRGKKNDREV